MDATKGQVTIAGAGLAGALLATLLARFRFSPLPGREPKPVMILTLRPQGGVWLRVERV